MRTDRHRHFGGQLLFGAIVITLGVIFMLQNFGLADAHEVFRWWPALLVAAGIAHFAQLTRGGNKTWGAVLIVVGSALLLRTAGIVDVNIWAWWPLILVAVGGSIVWRGIEHRRAIANPEMQTGDGEEYVNGSAVMGAWERRITSRQFRGGELNTMMGGVDLDLRGAVMAGPEARLSVSAFMGGIKIRIPQSWAVDARVTPFMGGVEDNSFAPQLPGAPLLIITGTAFMGGVEIGN